MTADDSYNRYNRETRFRQLLKALSPAPRDFVVSMTARPVMFVDTNTRELSAELTARPSGALCVYCEKQLCAWGKIHKKRKGGRFNRYNLPTKLEQQLDRAIEEHVYPCATEWIWRTLAEYSTEVMQAFHRIAVHKWMLDIKKAAKTNVLEAKLARMFDFLPAPMGSDMANRIELIFVTLNSLRWDAFEEGDEQHPHRFLKADWPRLQEQNVKTITPTNTDEQIAVEWLVPEEDLGMCPCGLVGPVGREATNVPTYKLEYR